ncbi:hypothetical protein [Natrinema salinisoli]|uniref:hypothetical protein n=1 Tax=Natrinema salinisoli TaxID=2878535 RepID=UPI001CF0810D|nr:hypothetical protein [Natrinema salinisoli]
MPFTLTAATIVAGITTVLAVYSAYKARTGGLVTEHEREQKIKQRLEDRTVPSDSWGLRVDDVLVKERSGPVYWVVKFVTGRISGETRVTLTYANAHVPGEVWEHENIQQIFTAFDFHVEHVKTVNPGDTVGEGHTVFVLQTVEWGDIVHFLRSIVKIEEYGREEMAG